VRKNNGFSHILLQSCLKIIIYFQVFVSDPVILSREKIMGVRK
jgi:hypothetical protein